MRCDCGYDFHKKTVDKSFDQGTTLPATIKLFLALQVLGAAYVAVTISSLREDAMLWMGMISFLIASLFLSCMLVLKKKLGSAGSRGARFPDRLVIAKARCGSILLPGRTWQPKAAGVAIALY
jgi:hypothetical protein